MWNKMLVAIATIALSTVVVGCGEDKDTGDTAGEDTAAETAAEEETE
jgi:hypothetical protein